MMQRKGFTIVELLIVVVVIAILATITAFTYIGLKKRADDSALSTNANTVAKQLELKKLSSSDGKYPSSISDIANGYPQTITYTQLDTGTHYCVTLSKDGAAYFRSDIMSASSPGACPDQAVTTTGSYALQDPDWTASQIPLILNGSISTTLAGASMTVSGVTSSGSITGTHIDGNNDSDPANPYSYCYPTNEIDGIFCPTTPIPDMQLTSGRTLTITVMLNPGVYNALSFLMSDVEYNTATVRAYDSTSSSLSSSLWRVISYDRAFDSNLNKYTSISPADRPNPYVNTGTGINFSPMTSQNDDTMRVIFDESCLQSLAKVVIEFTSSSTTDWIQWGFLARHS